MSLNLPTIDGLSVALADGVVSITIDRAERRNALTNAMVHGLIDALDAAAADDQARVVVLQSSNDHFCSGADIGAPTPKDVDGKTIKPRTGHMRAGLHSAPHRLITTVQESSLPVIAAVRGAAAGLGNALALSADFVIASRTAKFWSPFVGRGFTPDSATTYMLPRLIGAARARQMVLRSTPIDGDTAASWGLVAEVVDDDQLDATVAALAAELAGAATVAVGLAKSLLYRNADATLSEALYNEELAEELAIRSDDFKIGMKAFVTRTDAVFLGR